MVKTNNFEPCVQSLGNLLKIESCDETLYDSLKYAPWVKESNPLHRMPHPSGYAKIAYDAKPLIHLACALRLLFKCSK